MRRPDLEVGDAVVEVLAQGVGVQPPRALEGGLDDHEGRQRLVSQIPRLHATPPPQKGPPISWVMHCHLPAVGWQCIGAV